MWSGQLGVGTKFGLLEGNTTFSTQNGERLNSHATLCLSLPVYLSVHQQQQKYTDDNIKSVQKICNSQTGASLGVAIFSPFPQNKSINKQLLSLLLRSVSPALSGKWVKDFLLTTDTGQPQVSVALL